MTRDRRLDGYQEASGSMIEDMIAGAMTDDLHARTSGESTAEVTGKVATALGVRYADMTEMQKAFSVEMGKREHNGPPRGFDFSLDYEHRQPQWNGKKTRGTSSGPVYLRAEDDPKFDPRGWAITKEQCAYCGHVNIAALPVVAARDILECVSCERMRSQATHVLASGKTPDGGDVWVPIVR